MLKYLNIPTPNFQWWYWPHFVPSLFDQSVGQLPGKDGTDHVCSWPETGLVSQEDEVERPAGAELQERLQLARWRGGLGDVDQDTTEGEV